MKQHILQKINSRKRQWDKPSSIWGNLSLSIDEPKPKPIETAVKIESIEVPLLLVNAMERKGYITKSHSEQDISEFMLLAAQEKLYGRVRATRY